MHFLGIFFLLFFFATSSSASPAPATFCVQSFNIYGTAYAKNKQERTDAFIKSIKEENIPCDVLQLQEAWTLKQFTQLSSGLSSLRYLSIRNDTHRNDAYITGLASFFQGSVSSEYSSRYQVNNVDGALDWFRDLLYIAKGFSFTETKLDHSPQTIFFINTHTHPRNTAVRLTQMLQLLHAVLERKSFDKPILFTGDLNANPNSIELILLRDVLLLKDSFLETNFSYENICTYCKDNPLSWSSEDSVIDYILYRNLGKLKLTPLRSEVNMQSYEDLVLSDHFGLRTYFQAEEIQTIPQLLPLDSPELNHRIENAISTLEKVYNILLKQNESYLAESLFYTKTLLQELKNRDPSSPILKYFQEQ